MLHNVIEECKPASIRLQAAYAAALDGARNKCGPRHPANSTRMSQSYAVCNASRRQAASSLRPVLYAVHFSVHTILMPSLAVL